MLMSGLRHALAVCGAMLILPGGVAMSQDEPGDGPFTLEAVMGAPFAEAPVAAAHAERFAWVVNSKGVRNIYTAGFPGFQAVAITAYREDDGQAIGGLALSDDGTRLLYVRGGSANRHGEIPNPESLITAPKQEIWLVPTTQHAPPQLIAEGSRPSFSPDGSAVIFAKGGALWQVQLPADLRPGLAEEEASSEATVPAPRPKPSPEGSVDGPYQPEKLFEARGSVSEWAWSPDGRALAFVSDRGSWSFIGLYRPRIDSIRWLAPGVGRDLVPTWSPDGTRIAFFRLPGLKSDERRYLMGSYSFQLMVSDLTTGRTTRIFTADNAQGYYPLSAGLPLHWTGNDRIIFQSEHEGHIRFYRIAASGGEVKRLTDGDCETETAAAVPDNGAIIISNNCSDISRRDLWRLDTVSGELTQLTKGDWVESDPAPAGTGRTIAFRATNARNPAGIHLMAADGGAPQRLFPLDPPVTFPADALVEPQNVTIQAKDKITSYGQLFLPPGAKGEAGGGQKFPAVIFMHGGPIRQMFPAWHTRGYYSNAYAMNQYLTSRGYVVLALNYRAGIGYGRDFRAVPDHGPRGSSEYRDVEAAGEWLAKQPMVDAARIGLWGGSYGGTLTGMGLSRSPRLFRTGVAFHGVFDWSLRSFRLSGQEGGGGWSIVGDDAQALAWRSSTVGDLSKWRAPVLLIAGDDDRNVVFDQTVDLARRLTEKGVYVETLVFPDEVHGFLRHSSWLRAYHATADFLDRFLKGNGR